MAVTFRNIVDGGFEPYFFNSERDLLKEFDDIVATNSSFARNYELINQTEESFIQRNAKIKGYNPNSPLSVAEQYSYPQISQFSDPNLLKDSLDSLELVRKSIDLGADFDAAKIKITSLPVGVFNFGLASKGLIRKVEYYDKENNIVVDDKLVREETISGQKSFYYTRDGKDVFLRKQQIGTTQIEKNCPGVEVLYDQPNDMFLPFKDGKIFNGCGSHKLKYASTNKKVYMYRQRLGGGLSRYIDLFVVAGGLATLDTEQFLIKNLPILLVADILERAGIKTRIYGLRAYYNDDSPRGRTYNSYVFAAYALKDYGEPLDNNRIAAFTSDKRFFRVNLWNAVSAIRTKRANNGTTYDGSGITLYGVKSNGDKDGLYECFAMFKNWIFNQKGTVGFDTKILDKNLMMLGGVRGISENDKLTGTLQQREATLKKVEEEAYRILDYVGLLMSKNPRKFIEKIYKREKEKNTYFDPKTGVANYFSSLLTDYMTVVPENQVGNHTEFATPADEKTKIEQRKKELIELIQQTLK